MNHTLDLDYALDSADRLRRMLANARRVGARVQRIEMRRSLFDALLQCADVDVRRPLEPPLPPFFAGVLVTVIGDAEWGDDIDDRDSDWRAVMGEIVLDSTSAPEGPEEV